MGTSTPNYELFKPATADFVDVTRDLNENFDKIDAHLHNGTYVPIDGTAEVNRVFGGIYAEQSGGGTNNQNRTPFGTLYVIDSGASGNNDFVGHVMQSVFTGDDWATAGTGTAPDVGMGFGLNAFTVTGTASGDGEGGTFFGQLSEFDIRSDATIKAGYGLSGEASFIGTGATGHAYLLQSLTAIAPKNKGGATNGTADHVFSLYVNPVHSGNQTVLNGTQALNTGTITVVSNRDFPTSGTLKIGDPLNGIPVQTITYTGKGGQTQFTGCTGGNGTSINTGTPVGDGNGDLDSFRTWSMYVAGGHSFFGGAVTIQGEFGQDASRPALLVRAVASHSGRVFDVRTATTDVSLLKVDHAGVATSFGDFYANEVGSGRTAIGALGPSGESAVLFGSSGDASIYRVSSTQLRTAEALDAVGGLTQNGTPVALDLGIVHTTDPRLAAAPLAFSGANRCLYSRVAQGGTISKIATDIGVSSGNISVAVYRNTGSGRNAAPGTRVATSGAVASPGTGYQEISLGGSVEVFPGDWLAISADNTTITLLRTTVGSATAICNGFVYRQDSAHPAPSSAASLTVTAFNPVLVGVA